MSSSNLSIIPDQHHKYFEAPAVPNGETVVKRVGGYGMAVLFTLVSLTGNTLAKSQI